MFKTLEMEEDFDAPLVDYGGARSGTTGAPIVASQSEQALSTSKPAALGSSSSSQAPGARSKLQAPEKSKFTSMMSRWKSMEQDMDM